jgi:hypothetical protein
MSTDVPVRNPRVGGRQGLRNRGLPGRTPVQLVDLQADPGRLQHRAQPVPRELTLLCQDYCLNASRCGYSLAAMDGREIGISISDDVSEPLRSDPDRRVILARRNRLIAIAVVGLASTLSCGGRTAMDQPGGKDPHPTHTPGSAGSAGRGAGGSEGGQGGADGRVAALSDAGGQDAFRFFDAFADTADADTYRCEGCASCGSPGCYSCT